MKPSLNWRYLAAGILCLVGLLGATIAIINSQGRPVVSATAPTDEPAPLGIGLVAVREAGVDAIVDRTTEVLSRQATEAALPDHEALVADAGAILSAWLGGTADDYLRYLERNGHTPPQAPIWNDPQLRDQAWLQVTQPLREASFDPSGVRIRTSFEKGQAIPIEKSNATGWRFDKLSGHDEAFPDPDRLASSNLTIKEVLIPMRSKSANHGAQFNGLLALSYAQDPRTSRWTLISVSVYDVPKNDTARIPPF